MPKRKHQRGDFFSVDRWTWGQVCELGRMNEAVGYLIAAQGTGADNRYTSWSVTAMQKYAGIGWERGRSAVEALIQSGFFRRAEASTKEKPLYELVPSNEISRAQFERNLASLTDYERLLLEGVRSHKRLSRTVREAVRRLAERGILKALDNGDYVPAEPYVDRDPIWIPNSLVVGAKSAKDAPVRRLRISQDLWALRLLVDLYHEHYLADYGGINPTVLRQVYQRELVGEQGIYRVWGFRSDDYNCAFAGPLSAHRQRPKESDKRHPVWDSIDRLRVQGLLTYVPHLFEGDPASSQAEVIHPCAGEPAEVEIGRAAHRAGLALLPEFKKVAAGWWLVPVEKAIPNVQMVGIARLRHRPHTRKTGAWHTHLKQASEEWIEHYSAVLRSAENATEKVAQNQ